MITNNKFRVFIAGEHPIYRELRRQYLLNLGFKNVLCFDHAADCIAQLAQQPDIILIDHTLLPSNGLETLREIKTINPDVYILFIAGKQHTQAAIEALRAGAFDYIVRGENEEEHISAAIGKITALLQDAPNRKEDKRFKLSSLFPF